jgi:hypothetical protein
VCVYLEENRGYCGYQNNGTGPHSFKPEDGGSLFLRNTGVKYIHIVCHSAEHYTLANPRREAFNLLKTKRRLLHLKTQSVPRCKHFSPRL